MGRLQAAERAKDEQIALLKAKVVEQADEIARLKGLPPRPKFKGKPSGMEQATSKALGKRGRKRGRGSKRENLAAAHFQGHLAPDYNLAGLLTGMGLEISKRQVARFLTQGLEVLVSEDQAVLRMGLETARWITVDDTSARHAGQDQFTTQFGDGRFEAFRTGASKSRQRFLYDLQCGRADIIVDAAALAHMRRLNLAGPLLDRLAGHPAKRFTDEAAWRAHLETLGFDHLKISPDPVKVATEGALLAAVKRRGCCRTRSSSPTARVSSASPITPFAGSTPSS